MGLRKLQRQAERRKEAEKPEVEQPKKIVIPPTPMPDLLKELQAGREDVLPGFGPLGGLEALKPAGPKTQPKKHVEVPVEDVKLKQEEGSLDGVKPIGKLREFETTSPKVEMVFPLQARDEIGGIVGKASSVQSGIGWFMSKQSGGGEFFVPKMEDELFSQRFDETGVVDRWSGGGYSAVFMLVFGHISCRDLEHFHESTKKIQDSAGVSVPTYLVQLNTLLPNVAVAKAYRINPNAGGSVVEDNLKLSRQIQEDILERQNRLTKELLQKYDRPGVSVEQILRSSMNDRADFTGKYVAQKFGDPELGRQASEKVSGAIRSQMKESVKHRQEALTMASSLIILDQTSFIKLFVETDVVEGVEITNSFGGFLGLNDHYESAVVASKLLSQGLKLDSQAKYAGVWVLGEAASPLGDRAKILGPIAAACAEENVEPNETTYKAISDNISLIRKCAVYQPPDDEEYDKTVSLTVARGRVREALWKRIQVPGMNTPEELSEILGVLMEDKRIPKSIKDDIDTKIKNSTERTVKELINDEDLMVIHSSPVAEVIHSGLEATVKHIEDAIGKEKSNANMPEDQIKAEIEKSNKGKSKSQRTPINEQSISNFRRSAQAKVESLGQLKERIAGAQKITPEDYTSEMLVTIADGAEKDTTERAGAWTSARKEYAAAFIVKLFPGQPAEQLARRRESSKPVADLKNEEASRQADELIKDMVCLTRNAGQLDEQLESITAYSRLQAEALGGTDIGRRDLPQLARERVFVGITLGENTVEARLYDGIIQEKVPDAMRADYRRIEEAYRRMIEALPGEMKL